jgi:hypothetical protein
MSVFNCWHVISEMSRPAVGLNCLHMQWVLRVISKGVKRSECEADHSTPSSTEVKVKGSFTLRPLRNNS